MYCPNCGSDNQAEVKFCRRCGTGLAVVSEALARKGKNREQEKPQLAELIKSYHSGRHKMMFGAGSVGLGIALIAVLFAVGHWGLFWIFLWVFMGLFGNGVHQFNKGWREWSEASVELKALGYPKPPIGASEPAQSDSRLITEPRATESLLSDSSAPAQPASITESTTRHLTNQERK